MMYRKPAARRRSGARWALVAASAAAVLVATASPAPAQTTEGRILGADSAKRIKDSYLVVLHGNPTVTSTADRLTEKHGGEVRHLYSTALNGFSVKANERSARDLAADPAVAYVEANQKFETQGVQPNPPSWGLDRVDQDQLPLDSSYTYPDTSSNVTAYIIDTGIRITHNDFGGRASWGINTTGDGRNTDCNGHGTHVAGTTGGSQYGVGKAPDLVAVKVLGCDGSGTTAGVVDGIDWVTQNATQPAVANMSLGGGASTALDNAVKNSIASGVPYAVAAGNDSANACNYSPARVPEAITVGATTSSDGRSSFSNYGSCLDIFAPGSGITSAWNGSDSDSRSISGTSMASPHVAGAAGLVKGANPSWSPQQVRDHLVTNATSGVVGSPGSGSPNLLLRVLNGGGEPDPDNDFALEASPASGSVQAGGSTGSKITTSVTSGTAETITFSASGLPSGANASFSPSSVTAGSSSSLTLSTSASTPTGTYQVSVTGRSPSAEHTVTFALTVTGGGGGDCPSPGQKLSNPGFESGSTAWSASAYVITTSATPHSGNWTAWLNGWGQTRTDYVQQNVSLPAGCTSYELSYWLHINTDEYTSSIAYDTLKVQVLTADGSRVLGTLKTYSNLDAASGYTQHTLDLGAYAGQDVRVRFLGEEDVYYQTSFVIDDTAVNVS